MADIKMKKQTVRIVIVSILIILAGGGITGWIMNRLGLMSLSDWNEPSLPMPIISTRGHFRNGKLTREHGVYDYETIGKIPGYHAGTRSPDDLLIIVHGFNNYPQEASNSCGRAQRSLQLNGFDAALVGYSWDANTQLDPMAMVGFHEGRIQATMNGPKLARFIVDYKAKCPTARIHVLGYSLGVRTILECLRVLDENPAFRDLPVMIDSIHMVGASVDNEEVQTNHLYGKAIENRVGTFYNYYSREDNVLGWLYLMKEGDRALGETDIENRNFAPSNYVSVDAHNELVSLDQSGQVSKGPKGDNHMGCLGLLDENGNVIDDGVMNLVAENILGMNGSQEEDGNP